MRTAGRSGNGTTQPSQRVFERVLLIGIRSAEGIRAEHRVHPNPDDKTDGQLHESSGRTFLRSLVVMIRTMSERSGYTRSRLNATKHGVLSGHLLPWEDRDELAALHEALVAEHAPEGPTEHHLVEEIAGIMWRKHRVVLAEAAVYRTGLRKAVSYGPSYDSISSRALAHLNERDVSTEVSRAIRATADDTADELAEVEEAETAVRRALEILGKGKAGAYEEALFALHPSTWDWWTEALEEGRQTEPAGHDDCDEQCYSADVGGLASFLYDEVLPWLARRRQALEHRPLIRAQALGEALNLDQLDKLARYETHLDRRLGRVLGMLLKLKDVRRTITPDAA
jgi:hypothetical protein